MFNSIADIRAANARKGHMWFSPDSMRFWRCAIHGKVIKGRYFITSEQYSDSSGRRYTIREANQDGTISTVGKFQQFATLKEAREAASELPEVYA